MMMQRHVNIILNMDLIGFYLVYLNIFFTA